MYRAHEEKEDLLLLRDICRRIYGREAKDNSEQVRVYQHLRKLKERGYVKIIKEKEDNNGKKNRYRLTEYGKEWAEEMIRSEYYCDDCGDFKDEEEIIKRPSCPDCGTPVKLKRKN